MEVENGTTQDVLADAASAHLSATAINNQYAVWAKGSLYSFQKLAAQDEAIQLLAGHGQNLRSRPGIALSVNRPSTIAISSGAQTRIFDLSIQALKCTITGIGRTITALSWSLFDFNILATGSIDGSVCLWDLRVPDRPIRRLRAPQGPCEAILFSTASRHSVACLQERQISIWDLRRRPLHPTRTICADGPGFCGVAWHPETPWRLLVATDDGHLTLYDVVSSIEEDEAESSSSSSEGDDRKTASELSKQKNDLSPIWMAKLETSVHHVEFVNSNTLYALAWHRDTALIYEINENESGISVLYSHDFEHKMDAIHLELRSGTGILSSVGTSGVHTFDLPISVLDKIGRRTSSPQALPVTDDAVSLGLDPNTVSKSRSIATMKPISVLSQQKASPNFTKTSEQLQTHRLLRQQKTSSKAADGKTSLTGGSKEPSTPPANRSVTSSLELPSRDEENGASTMPFLSPSIPSQRSPNNLPSLEDSMLTLPPLATPPLESSLASTASTAMEARDSDDSDDDTFVEALEGSTTFLPGGINVPLPKACGALFAPNGQLLTFFPPKLRPISSHGRPTRLDGESNERRAEASRVSRLFPSFGKFGGRPALLDDDDESDSTRSSDSFAPSVDRWPQFTVPQASFPSQRSWPSRLSPAQAGYSPQAGQIKVIVSVHEINDVSALCTSQKFLAERYRILPEGSESRADICDHNSATAEAAGLPDTAHIWGVVGMLLGNQVPLELLSDERADRDILVVAKKAKILVRSDSSVDLPKNGDGWQSFGQLRWAGDPFGASWLVRRVLEWVEQRSDIQLLACICAVLTDAHRSGMWMDARPSLDFTGLLTSLDDYVAEHDPPRRRSSTRSVPPIPVLRTNSLANSSSVYESPIKAHRSSNTSSRNASQPTTPYLDSTASTPPFSLSISRQGTHLSTSGSASPEYQRSSFSAAAKYYAQSITNKFASYETSPPTKKTGTSPGTSNELSASLPGGSWGKSVSFAMTSITTENTRGNLLSRSYDEPAPDTMYNSDRTVDDVSPALQTRDPSGAVHVAELNQALFADDVSGAAKTSLIPVDLAPKAMAWCQYYTEQLHSWDLHLEAAELEKVVSIPVTSRPTPSIAIVDAGTHIQDPSTRPQNIDRTCSICFTTVRLLELVCPACQHVAHLSCLQTYLSSVETAAEDFECPTSCGCPCAEIVYIVPEIRAVSEQSRPGVKKRMPSYTDPRFWRARMEEDNRW